MKITKVQLCYNGDMKYDIVIIGAGVAGMTAAIYAKRAGKSVVVLEALARGGQAIQTENIENYPGFDAISGAELTEKIYHQMNNLDVKIQYETVIKCIKNDDGFSVITDEAEYSAGAVIIAVGAKYKPMGVKNESKMVGKGVSYCATCDGALYRRKAVAVVGGGNSALYSALYLADIAKKVYLVNRGQEFKGDQIMVEELKNRRNVELVLNADIKEVVGSESVEGLRIVKNETERILIVEGIFVNVGRAPDTEVFEGLVEMDRSGYIVAGEDCQTSCKNIYAAGDCRKKFLRQLVTAASDGAVAASKAAGLK